MERLVVSNSISDGCSFSYDEITPILFESKEAAENLFVSTLLKQEEEYKESDEFRFVTCYFELFGIEFDIWSKPRFYTLDEWYSTAYNPTK